MIVVYVILTLIATGWIVLLFSKLPFLNIITDVLFIHVPEIENVLQYMYYSKVQGPKK